MPITIETVTQLTGAIVKSLYEAEADTNAFTDTEKTKLGSLSVFTTVSQADAEAGISTTVYNWTPQRVAQAIAALAGVIALDVDEVDLTSGNFTAKIGYVGASAPTISSGGAGDYTITIPSGTMFLWGNLFANNTTINGSNELEFNLDNSANSANRWLSAQILDANNGGLVDAHALSVNYTQTITSNVTTILFPSFNINGANGFRIMLS